MEELEPNLGMLLLIFGCFLENLAYLDISVLLSPGGIIEILGVGLAFTGEGGEQVLFSLGSFQFHSKKNINSSKSAKRKFNKK